MARRDTHYETPHGVCRRMTAQPFGVEMRTAILAPRDACDEREWPAVASRCPTITVLCACLVYRGPPRRCPRRAASSLSPSGIMVSTGAPGRGWLTLRQPRSKPACFCSHGDGTGQISHAQPITPDPLAAGTESEALLAEIRPRLKIKLCMGEELHSFEALRRR
jgi:hypothetical protein